jgi:hypothetical protein
MKDSKVLLDFLDRYEGKNIEAMSDAELAQLEQKIDGFMLFPESYDTFCRRFRLSGRVQTERAKRGHYIFNREVSA